MRDERQSRPHRVVQHALEPLRPAAHVGVVVAGAEFKVGDVLVVAFPDQVEFHRALGLIKLSVVLIAELVVLAGLDSLVVRETALVADIAKVKGAGCHTRPIRVKTIARCVMNKYVFPVSDSCR